MKKVILAVLLIAVALFLVLPSLSWAQGTEELYKAKCAGCHGADGKGTAAGKKMGAPGVLVADSAEDCPTPNLPTSSKTAVRRRRPRTLSRTRV